MERIDVFGAFEKEPPAQDFIFPGFLAGTVGGLVAPGGAGKSILALHMAAAITCDHPQANTTGLEITAHGNVLYVNLEDPPDEIRRRLYFLGQRFDLVTRKCIAGGLHLSARQGIPTDVMHPKFHEELLKTATGKRLVIIDTLSRCHRLDENDNGQMAQLVAKLEEIPKETGASLLFLHHTSKGAALSGQSNLQQAARGASSLIDNARFSASLIKMTAEESEKLTDSPDGHPIGEERRGLFARYETTKQNYGHVEVGHWYRRCQGGILQAVKLRPMTKKKLRGRDDI